MNCSESLFYIVNEDINVRPNIGVKKKIFAQVRVFEKNFSWDVLLKDVVKYMKNEGR